MTTSATLLGDTVDGSENSYLDWQVASQSIPLNHTVINWQAGWKFDAYSCRGLRQGNAVINGTTVYHDFDSGDGVHAYNAAHDHRPGTGKLQTASGSITVAHNADGTKSFSASISMVGFSAQTSNASSSWTLPTIPRAPGAPSTPVISDVTQTSVTLSWTPNPGDGLPVTGYTIGYIKDVGGPIVPTLTVTSSTSPKTVTGLEPGAKYYFWVKATNSAGTGPYSTTPSNTNTIAGARINVGGVWKQAVPYVRASGVWKVARPWTKVLGEWEETI